MRIGIASCFRHLPEEDGPSAIQASVGEPREDMDEYARHATPDRPWVFPRLGFLAYHVGGKTLWGFIKYEAPQLWGKSYHFPNRAASMATTRVGDVACQQCGWKGVFPIRSTGAMTCPWCGRRGARVSPIKETSDRFSEMLGDLRSPLETAAKAAADAGDFEFPRLLFGSTEIAPSSNVPPAIQGAAQTKGISLVPAEEITLKTLGQANPESSLLCIVPGIYSGSLDAEEVKAGKAWCKGVVNSWVKLFVPDPPRGPVRFGSAKF